MADPTQQDVATTIRIPEPAPARIRLREAVPRAPAGRRAVAVGLGAVAASLLFAAFVDLADPFEPRVATVDALAGLLIAAFVVDRLLTFTPPLAARGAPDERAADLDLLRVAYGAVLGAVFVALTDLRAVAVLTGGEAPVAGGVDRAIAVLAVAGGVAGLARLLDSIHPAPATDGRKDPRLADAVDAAPPPPTRSARTAGAVAIAAAAAVALVATGDTDGSELVALDPEADGATGMVVRFGTVLLAAAVVEQLVERFGVPLFEAGRHRLHLRSQDKAIATGALAVVLGVLAARLLDLYLLHNVGFFPAPGGIDERLAASTELARWGDALATGLVIAAGTKPLHDLASRLRRAGSA